MRKQGPDKLDEVIVQLKRAHQYNPDDPQISLQLALCYESKEQLPDAAALLERVVQQAPDLSLAHVALTRIYFRLGKKTEGEREKATVQALQEKLDQQKVRSNSAPQSTMDDQP
jgi:Tfp pilus assembly protein PilF